MNDLPALTHLPLIPGQILRQHHVHEANDTRFRSCARLLQALWREDRDLPIGYHVTTEGKRRKLGSRITNTAGRAGANFLMPTVAALVQRELIYCEVGALIDEQRLRTNLLSSMPLCFNLLAPLELDLGLATRVLHLMCPTLDIHRVKSARFEHSPGRGDVSLTGDGTAFDALLTYETAQGRTGFVAIEVKYSEAGHEPSPTIRPRYDEIASTSGLFVDPSSRSLRANPLQQLFREHCLAQAMLMRRDYEEGLFIVIAPRLNHPMQGAIRVYEAHLNEPKPHQASFQNVTLEQFIGAMAQAGQEAYARALHRRYTDFWLVDGEIELALAELPKPVTPRGRGGSLRTEADRRRSLLSPLLSLALMKVFIVNRDCSLTDERFDPLPVTKLFTPDASATWLISAVDPADHDRAFGLCDLGLGCPELGWVSLSELAAGRGRLGLPVERDRYWTATKPISEYAAEARVLGRIGD